MSEFEHLSVLPPDINSESVAAFRRLSHTRSMDADTWVVRPDAIERYEWVIALMDGMWAGRQRAYYMDWIRRALDDRSGRLWGILWDDLDNGYDVQFTHESMAQFLSECDIIGGTLIDPELRLCVAANILDWQIVAGPREIVESVVHTSLETRWEQFTYFAEWGAPYESINRRRKELMRYYVPYNGLDSTAVPDEVSLPDYDRLAARAQPSDRDRSSASEMLNDEEFLNAKVIVDREWAMATICGNFLETKEYGIGDFLPSAEWLADATARFGNEVRVVDPDRGERAFGIPCTRDGWMAFESLIESGPLIAYPEHSQFVVLGLQSKFILIAGEPSFVAEALGDSSIRGNRVDLDAWIDLVRKNSEDAQKYVRKHLSRLDRLLEWYDETWEAIEAAGYFEDPWPIPWE